MPFPQSSHKTDVAVLEALSPDVHGRTVYLTSLKLTDTVFPTRGVDERRTLGHRVSSPSTFRKPNVSGSKTLQVGDPSRPFPRPTDGTTEGVETCGNGRVSSSGHVRKDHTRVFCPLVHLFTPTWLSDTVNPWTYDRTTHRNLGEKGETRSQKEQNFTPSSNEEKKEGKKEKREGRKGVRRKGKRRREGGREEKGDGYLKVLSRIHNM